MRDNRAEKLKGEMAKLTEQANRIEKTGYQADGVLIFGSTPDQVIKRSKIPVLVIPEDS